MKSETNIPKNPVDMNNFIDDYLEIIKSGSGDFVSHTQWNSAGDQFEKLSIYEDYTPVETSSNTQIK